MKSIFLTFYILSIYSISVCGQQSRNNSGKTFNNTVNSSYNGINDSVNYKSAHFKNNSYFTSTKFNAPVDFSFSNFDSIANFEKAEFYSPVTFRSIDFHSIVKFNQAKFYKTTAEFTFSDFRKTAYFTGVTFNSPAKFSSAIFHSDVHFDYTDFNSTADFSDTKFDSTLNFINVNFDSIANFNQAVFGSVVNFSNARLPSMLYLNDVKYINDEIDLTYSLTNNKFKVCKICLNNSDIDKIKFRYSRFELYFPDTTDVDIKTSVYEKLLAKQKKEGFISSVEKLDKEYMEFKYLKNGDYSKIWGYFLNFIDKIWWGYGYNKEYIIRNTLAVFLFFLLLNGLLIKYLSTHIYIIDKLEPLKARGKIFYFYFTVLYTGLIFFGLKISLQNLQLKDMPASRVFGFIYFFLMYLSGLICLAYSANYIITN
ncbi:pentapeptide repeat-containing protein [Maribellus maritimus]|uniref:pentapeptide repeat-containing protein n=1 Tax=Maribellus maritimus TaxID=2870838 RepID=UPI001EECE9F0|nr:pentapeptide repeat-containing protein [Maribellus maritimus]MCG6187554.1 pentapeptide repeat-containing protein [Maribellus maritimus]